MMGTSISKQKALLHRDRKENAINTHSLKNPKGDHFHQRQNGSVWSMIVRLASGLSYQKFALGRWSRIPSCVSTYVFSAQRSIYKKEEKDTPRTGSKLNNYFLRSGPLHTFSKALTVQDYTTSTLRLISNILHTTSNLLR